MNIKFAVRLILDKYPETREHDGVLAERYFQDFFNGTSGDFIRSGIHETLKRLRQMIQREFPELRGTNYQKRQLHAKIIRSKMRSQEKPEDLSHIFGEIKDNRPWYTKIFSK